MVAQENDGRHEVNRFGPQHDFRSAPDERLEDAFAFLEEELDNSTIWTEPVDAGTMIVVEGESNGELLQNLFRQLERIVERAQKITVYENGAEMVVQP